MTKQSLDGGIHHLHALRVGYIFHHGVPYSKLVLWIYIEIKRIILFSKLLFKRNDKTFINVIKYYKRVKHMLKISLIKVNGSFIGSNTLTDFQKYENWSLIIFGNMKVPRSISAIDRHKGPLIVCPEGISKMDKNICSKYRTIKYI